VGEFHEPSGDSATSGSRIRRNPSDVARAGEKGDNRRADNLSPIDRNENPNLGNLKKLKKSDEPQHPRASKILD